MTNRTSGNGSRPPASRSRQDSSRAVGQFLEQVRRTPHPAQPAARGRLMFSMDATLSRQPTWDTAMRLQTEMFAAAADLGGLDVQLCWFRGLNEFHATAWQRDADALLADIGKVTCRTGPTQLRRTFAHACAERQRLGQPIHALVHVGDAMEEPAETLLDSAGRLALLNIPLFLFQEGADPLARDTFQAIAKLTRGAWCPFDNGSAEQLRSLLSAVAVYASGGRRALLQHDRAKKDARIRALLKQL